MMSSEISTDAPALGRGSGHATGKRDAGFQPWQLFTLAGLLTASVVAFMAGDRPSPVRVALILTVLAAAAVGVAALRTLAPLAGRGGPSVPPVAGGRTRAALEREKALALRSIKELEFDRAMGKVSEKDFDEMSGRLRARAVRILRELDADTGYRDEIEREIARRLAETPGTAGAADSPPAGAQAREIAGEAGVSCAACGTGNDGDARFCKGCGARMGGA